MLQSVVVIAVLQLLGDATPSCDFMANLRESDPTTLKGIFCSPQLTKVRTSNFKEDKFIGYYRKTQSGNHICYYDKVRDDLIKLSTLSGGKMYTIGE